MKKPVSSRSAVEEETLPRVLIIGQTFTTDTGGGITLSGLFKNWPPDKLAIAVESKEPLDFNYCSNYYRIGYNELKMPFPFYMLQRRTKSGMVNTQKALGAVTVKQTHPLKEKLKRYFDLALHYTGVFYWIYGNQKVSAPLISWIKDFEPDVIYYQPNSYKSIDFVLDIQKQINVPLISHVMDDWFSFAVRPGPLKGFWQRRLDDKVKNLFAATRLHLSICSYMSDAYLERYGYTFFPFHNAADLKFWASGAHKQANVNGASKILYAGRVGYGLETMLLKVADAVENLGRGNPHISLEIQTKDQNHPLVQTLKGYKNTEVTWPIPYARLPEKFSAADILLIPCDFSGPGVRFIKYSMPTKASEYMATGTPILVVGPPKTALVEYAKEGWASVCESERPEDIQAAIKELINNDLLRKNITDTAQRLALKNHDQQQITDQFRKRVVELCDQDYLNN